MLTKNISNTATVIASSKVSNKSRDSTEPIVNFYPTNNHNKNRVNNSKSNKSVYQLSLMTGPVVHISNNNCDDGDLRNNPDKQFTAGRQINDRKTSFTTQTSNHKNRVKVKKSSCTLQSRCRKQNSRCKIKPNKLSIDTIQNGKSINKQNKTQENIAIKKMPCKTNKQTKSVEHSVKSRPNKNSGFITCLVCNQTKFYSHVQRRYGIFSCEPCFKFFAKFIKEPKQFVCENQGKCLIIVFDNDNHNPDERPSKLDASNCTGSRCKACWLKHCLDKFKINSDIKQLLVAKYYPQIETDRAVAITQNVDNEQSKTTVAGQTAINHTLKCPNKIAKLKICQTIDGQSKRINHKLNKVKPNIASYDKDPKLETLIKPLNQNCSTEMADNADSNQPVSTLSDIASRDKSNSVNRDQPDESGYSKKATTCQEDDNEKVTVAFEHRNVPTKDRPQPNELTNKLQSQLPELSTNNIQFPVHPANDSSAFTSTQLNPPKCNPTSSPASKSNDPYSAISSLSLQATLPTPIYNADKANLYSNTLPDFNNSFFPKLIPTNFFEKPHNVAQNSSTNLHFSEKFTDECLKHKPEPVKCGNLSDNKPRSNNLEFVPNNAIKSHNTNQHEKKIDFVNPPKSISTKNSNHKRAINKEQNRFCNGKKSRCKDCEGCRAQDCGQCTYCLDKKKFGGQNVIKQACKFRVCIRFKNSQKLRQQNSSLPNCVGPTSRRSDKTCSVSASSSLQASGSSNPPSIPSSQSFYPTPPPHSNSHGSPNSLVSSNILNHSGHSHKAASSSSTSNDPNSSSSMFNSLNSQSHLSLPTPTSSPLSQVSVTNYRPTADPSTILDNYNNGYDNCYGNTPFSEQDTTTTGGNSFASNSITSNGYNYAPNLNRPEQDCQPAAHNGEPTGGYSYPTPIGNLNFNCKLNPCSTKLDHLQGQLLNSGQYCTNTPDYIAGNVSYGYPNDYLTTQQPNTKTNWHSQHSTQFSNINQAPDTFNNSYNFYNHNSPFPFHSYNYEQNYYY